MGRGLDTDNLLDSLDLDEVEIPTLNNATIPKAKESPIPIEDDTIPAVGILNKVGSKDSNARLKSDRVLVYKIDPKKCRPWKYHDRMDESVTKEKLSDLINSIREEGQRDPALVRRLEGDGQYEFEILYGRRRHAACLILDGAKADGFPFQAVIRDVKSDEDAAYWTWIENEENEPITDFERGVYFRKLLGKIPGYPPVFGSQDDLCKRFNRDKGKVSKLVQCATLLDNADIMKAVPNRAEIPFTYGYKIVGLLGDKKKSAMIIREAKIQAKKKGPKTTLEVIKALLGSVSPVKPVAPKPQYFGMDGKPELIACVADKKGKVTIKVDSSAKDIPKSKLKGLFDQVIKELF